LDRFTQAVGGEIAKRCAYCYAIRLDETARTAKEQGFAAFSTTLTVSPYQNHELIRQIGEKAGKKHGVEFRYFDFAKGFREGQAKARELGMYMQKYCGCVYSEEERYQKQIAKDQEKFKNR
jgi:predicted adenine nucleotide alpha hydrolase (AANH) superfamily ATPase